MLFVAIELINNFSLRIIIAHFEILFKRLQIFYVKFFAITPLITETFRFCLMVYLGKIFIANLKNQVFKDCIEHLI